MSDLAPLATVFGGSGFVGRYVTQRLARAGWRVRVAVRRPNEALFVRPYGVVGQVEPVQANIRDEASTRRAIAGAAVVVNCVGILVEEGRQRFDAVQDEGAGRVARIAAEEGVERLVHISAIGADPAGPSAYARSKAAGEAAVQAAFPTAVILRPSIVFGPEDGFFNRIAGLAQMLPVVPVFGPETRFQPVYVDDVAAATVAAATGEVRSGIYELGGPEVASFRELAGEVLHLIERRRMVVAVPWPIARLKARFFDFVQRASFGIVTNRLITADQVLMLQRDNVVAEGARGFADLGIVPTPMEAVLESYLYAYRRHGQFRASDTTAQAVGD